MNKNNILFLLSIFSSFCILKVSDNHASDVEQKAFHVVLPSSVLGAKTQKHNQLADKLKVETDTDFFDAADEHGDWFSGIPEKVSRELAINDPGQLDAMHLREEFYDNSCCGRLRHALASICTRNAKHS